MMLLVTARWHETVLKEATCWGMAKISVFVWSLVSASGGTAVTPLTRNNAAPMAATRRRRGPVGGRWEFMCGPCQDSWGRWPAPSGVVGCLPTWGDGGQ